MRFEEDAVDSCSDSGAGEWLDEFGLAATGVTLTAGKLDGMSDVEDDGIAKFLQDGEGTHVHDEILVAERGTALGENDVGVAGASDFFDDVGHVPGRDELGLFYVDDAAGFCGGEEKIGLASEEGGDLKNVGDFGGGLGLGGFVNVGEDGEAEIGFNFAEDAKAFGEAGAAKGFDGGAIRFVVGGFEDVGDAGVGSDFGDAFGHFAGVRF